MPKPAGRLPPPPIPVTLLTGFLGAGKTTLLNRLVKDPALAGAVVLINEFGEIGLDHLLVEAVEGDMMLMSSGCLCCTIRGDLVAKLEDLLRRVDNGRMKRFDRLLIETTGLADPAPVLHTIMAHPYLVMRYSLDGVVTLVDAVNGAATLDNHEEALKQAAVADRLVLTKTDLLPAGDDGAALRARLQDLNPGAIILDAARGEADAAALIGLGPFDPAGKIADVSGWLAAEAVAAAADHDHPHRLRYGAARENAAVPREISARDDDVNRHDARIRAHCLTRDKPMPASAFPMFLDLLRQAHGPHLLRVKGLVALDDDPARPVVVHGVQHVLHPTVRLDAWPDADRRTRMVFILRDLDPDFVEGLWRAFAGEAQVDRADAAALTDNPLVVGRGGLLA